MMLIFTYKLHFVNYLTVFNSQSMVSGARWQVLGMSTVLELYYLR